MKKGLLQMKIKLLIAIRNESNPVHLSRMLTVAALSRLNRNNQDSLATSLAYKSIRTIS